MAKMTKGSVNKFRVCSMLFYGEPGSWQTTDGRFDIIRDYRLINGDQVPVWRVFDNAEGDWAFRAADPEFRGHDTMREAVTWLKALMEEVQAADDGENRLQEAESC